MAFGTIKADRIEGTNVTFDFSSSGSFEITGNLLPDADNTLNLGSPTARFANVYTGDLHLRNERGDWTVVEEAEYLTLKNNRTNKTYKLLMEEV